MADFSVSGIIEGDASGFQEAINQASEALSSFAETALAVFGGEELAGLFNGLISGVSGVISSAISASSEFQNFSTVSGLSLNSTAESFNAAVAAFSNGAAGVSSGSLAAQDALIKYQEKIEEIQQNITDVMAGQNIIDAQANFKDRLASIDEAYASKVASIQQQLQDVYANTQQTHADKVQSMNDTLADMQTSHGNKIADLEEQYAQKISETKSAVEIKKLKEELTLKEKLENDSFQRQYDTKKAQQERDIAESDAKEKAAADKKVSTLQAELSKESKLHDEQTAKLKKQEDEQVTKLEADNAKKLASYQRELADEERAFKLSQEKRSSGGGGRENSMGMIHVKGQPSGEFGTMGETVAGLNKQIDELSEKDPFTKMQLEETAKRATAVGLNFGAIGGMITDLAASKGKQPMEALMAVIEATHGRTMALRNEFGITGDTLNFALGKTAGNTKFTYNEILQGLQKVNDQAGYTGGAEKLGGTYEGALMKIKNSFTDLAVTIMKPGVKGGFLDELQKGLLSFARFLEDHRKEIVDFVKTAVSYFLQFAKVIGEVAGFIKAHWDVISSIFIGFGILLAAAFIAIVGPEAIFVAAITAIVAVLSFLVYTVLAAALAWIVGTFVKGIVSWITSLHLTWTGIWKSIGKAVGDTVDFLKDNFTTILSFIGPPGLLIAAIVNFSIKFIENIRKGQDAFSAFKNAIAGTVEDIGHSFQKLIDFAKNALSYLNPFAKHSPSLVEQVQAGVNEIKKSYGEIGNLKINSPNLTAAHGGSSVAYNSYQTNSPNVSMMNSFNVNNPANASNVAAYLAYQLEYKGLF